MYQKEAVFAACDEIGVRSNSKQIQQLAIVIYGDTIALSTVYMYRCLYKRAKKIKADCRTYKGQPRRNMLKDDEATLGQVKRLNAFFKNKKISPNNVLDMIGNGKDAFHSIEQFRNAVEDLVELAAA